MVMMTSQILRLVHFTKTQKSKYFENGTLHIKGYFITKNSFAAEVNFKFKHLPRLRNEIFELSL